MFNAVESMEIVKKSPTDAVPLYARTALCEVASFEVELHEVNKHTATSSTSRTVFIRETLHYENEIGILADKLEPRRLYRSNDCEDFLKSEV